MCVCGGGWPVKWPQEFKNGCAGAGDQERNGCQLNLHQDNQLEPCRAREDATKVEERTRQSKRTCRGGLGNAGDVQLPSLCFGWRGECSVFFFSATWRGWRSPGVLNSSLCCAIRTVEEGRRPGRQECLQNILIFQIIKTNTSVLLIKCKGLF